MEYSHIMQHFPLDGQPIREELFGGGHINKTLRITTDTGKEYVLQHINQYVFPKPVEVMENVSAVTAFLRQADPDPSHSIHFLPTKDGRYYHRDADGEYWRMYDFIGGFCLDTPEGDEDLYQSALAFGRFQSLLGGFPAHTLHATIPHFHDTVHRFQILRESITADPLGRVAEVGPELEYLFRHEELACSLHRMLEAGELPLRVTHNDTKLNNVLLDKTTRKAICVLDLDTVMPGLSLYDFGDAIRFGAATGPEDCSNLEKMGLDLHLFEVFTRGFLESARNLTEKELQLLPLGAFVITLELSTRFLKDHIDGDRYFFIHHPGHNLQRARAQMRLAQDMLDKLPQMQAIVEKVRSEL